MKFSLVDCRHERRANDHQRHAPGNVGTDTQTLAKPGSFEFDSITQAEGADWHCEPAARLLRDERTCDWLASVFDAIG